LNTIPFANALHAASYSRGFGEADARKRYVAIAGIVLLHVVIWNLLHHAKLGAALREADRPSMSVFFLSEVLSLESLLPEPSVSAKRTSAHAKTVDSKAQSMVSVPAVSTANPIDIVPETPPAATEPREDIVAKSSSSIASVNRDMRKANELPRDTESMWGANKFEKAIASAAK